MTIDASQSSASAGGGATETTQLQILGAVDQLEGYTDQLEGFVDQLEGYTDTLEQKLQDVINGQNIRPAQRTGRVHKELTFENVAVTTNGLYVVTATKVLYVTSLFIQTRNIDATVSGQLRLKDGATTMLPFSVSIMVTGAPTPRQVITLTFEEPMRFTTDVSLEVVAGNTQTSIYLVGYEE